MNFLKNLFGLKSNETIKDQEMEEPSSEIENEYQKTINILEKHKRTAYIPVTEISELQFSTKSKFGGYPYLRNETDWPICPNCNKNMQLFLQLNLEDLPKAKEKGLTQLFYCTSSEPLCESDLEAFFPFSKVVECRTIEIEGEPFEITPKIDELFEERIILSWEAKDDYPHYEEYEQLNIDLDLDDDVYELMEEREQGLTIQEDKLFGWPYWVQSVEYPFDRQTESQMDLIFQISSGDNLPYMFGDVGVGHLTQSPDNKSELGFGWACS
ncbi:MAG: DUF1963 domain-containing protein [Flavobacteriaceae bacterium]|nr:DUF1963 domain-containing protein [Flavobacteriaceae bacterium]